MLLDWMAVTKRFRPFVHRMGASGLLALLAGCSSILPPSTPVQTNSQFLTASISPGGSSMTTFTLASQTVVGIALVSVVDNASGHPTAPSMVLQLGTPTGSTACSATASVTVTPNLVASIQKTLSSGTYCALVQDNGLTEPGTVTVRINTSNVAPVNVPNPTSLDVFSSSVGPLGSATHQVPIAFNGAVTVSMIAAGTANPLGLALGVWDGQVCRLNTVVDTTATGAAAITTTVDPGNYCLRVFDLGTLTTAVLFTVDTTHP